MTNRIQQLQDKHTWLTGTEPNSSWLPATGHSPRRWEWKGDLNAAMDNAMKIYTDFEDAMHDMMALRKRFIPWFMNYCCGTNYFVHPTNGTQKTPQAEGRASSTNQTHGKHQARRAIPPASKTSIDSSTINRTSSAPRVTSQCRKANDSDDRRHHQGAAGGR